ncbi:MAG: NAD(P)/FAD-dependent oxidoreductase, partial [Acetobacteraceae bacterium]
RNIVRPRFLSMLRDLVRFYRQAPVDLPRLGHETTLGAYLGANGYGRAFQRDHLLPMAAAIWSAPADQLRDHPATAFIRFCDNHGLLKFRDRPIWRTVTGGSRTYVRAMATSFAGPIRSGCAATSIRRLPDRVVIHDSRGGTDSFDHVVLATHADQALALLEQPSNPEARLLGCFRSTPNLAVLHSDATLMPRRRKIWSSWNYIGEADRPERACVTYWMNRLQDLPGETPLFVTLNPDRQPRPDTVLHTEQYEHPQFDTAAVRAQRDLWSLQGRQRTWFCGAWFGAGFHEDGLQAGLAVAEQLGGIRRPWDVANENGRIHVGDPPSQVLETA